MSRQSTNLFGTLIALTIAAGGFYACGAADSEFDDIYGAGLGTTSTQTASINVGPAVGGSNGFTAYSATINGERGFAWAAASAGAPPPGLRGIPLGNPPGGIVFPGSGPAWPWNPFLGCTQVSSTNGMVRAIPGFFLWFANGQWRAAGFCHPAWQNLLERITQICVPDTILYQLCTVGCFPTETPNCSILRSMVDSLGENWGSYDLACDGNRITIRDIEAGLAKLTATGTPANLQCRDEIVFEMDHPQFRPCLNVPTYLRRPMPTCGPSQTLFCNIQASPPQFGCRDPKQDNPNCPVCDAYEVAMPRPDGSCVCVVY